MKYLALLFLSFSVLAEEAPELYDFETIIDERDTKDIVHVVAFDREFEERIYCIRGVEYIFESDYTLLIGRNGLPFSCSRIKIDEQFITE